MIISIISSITSIISSRSSVTEAADDRRARSRAERSRGARKKLPYKVLAKPVVAFSNNFRINPKHERKYIGLNFPVSNLFFNVHMSLQPPPALYNTIPPLPLLGLLSRLFLERSGRLSIEAFYNQCANRE